MTTTIDTHHVKRIETLPRKELKCDAGGYTRTIVVTDDKGEEIRLVMFAEDWESLSINGDRL